MIIMSAVPAALLLLVPALTSCASTGGRQAASLPAKKADSLVVTTSEGSWQLITLDSARVDSLRQAGVMLEENVDERPEILFGPQLEYPIEARRECVTGRVLIQAIIGLNGRAEASSVGVRRRLDPRLEREALRYVWRASFKPGKVQGVTVRTLVNIPIDFKIRGGRC